MPEWRQIPGWPRYAVTRDGRARGPMGPLKPFLHKATGYLGINAIEGGRRSLVYLHRAVLLAFRGAPPTPKHEGAHGDGNKVNCRLGNLHWETRLQNQRDRRRHGTAGWRYTVADVRRVRALRARGLTLLAIAQATGVELSTVKNINRGKSWTWVK